MVPMMTYLHLIATVCVATSALILRHIIKVACLALSAAIVRVTTVTHVHEHGAEAARAHAHGGTVIVSVEHPR